MSRWVAADFTYFCEGEDGRIRRAESRERNFRLHVSSSGMDGVLSCLCLSALWFQHAYFISIRLYK